MGWVLAANNRFIAPKQLTSLQQVQDALQRVQEQLDALTRPTRPNLVTKNTTLLSGEFVRISPRQGAVLVAKLPKAAPENHGDQIHIALEQPAGTLRIAGEKPDLIGGAFTQDFTDAGLVILESNGTDQWVLINQLSTTSPTGLAQVILGAASPSFPNGRVLRNGFHTTADLATPGFAEIDWTGVDLLGDGSLVGVFSAINFTADSPLAVAVTDSGGGQGRVNYSAPGIVATTGAVTIPAGGGASLFAGIRDNNITENDRTNLNLVTTVSIVASVVDDAANDELEFQFERAALTGFAVASQNSNATTSAEPIVTFSASANMSNERVLSAGDNTAIDVATANQIQVDWTGFTMLDNAGVLVGTNQATRFLRAVSTTSNIATAHFAGGVGDVTQERAALTGAIEASQNSNATVFGAAASGAGLTGAGTATLSVGAGEGIVVGGTAVSLANGSVAANGTQNALVLASDTTRVESNNNLVLNGMVAAFPGQHIDIYAGGNHTITVNHLSGSAAAADQFALPDAITYGPRTRGGMRVVHDGVWRVIATAMPDAESLTNRLLAVHSAFATDASITITPPAEATWFEFEIKGAGGGGGGAETAATDGALAAGGGGGEGESCEGWRAIVSGNITGSIGAGGTAGAAATGANGGTGGNTVLTYNAASITATGAFGGVGSGNLSATSGTNVADNNCNAGGGGGGDAGTSDTSTFFTPGQGGGTAVCNTSATLALPGVSATQGPSVVSGFGGGRNGSAASNRIMVATTVPGNNGKKGCGASGAACATDAVAAVSAAGGTGGPGYMIVKFYSGPAPTFSAIT